MITMTEKAATKVRETAAQAQEEDATFTWKGLRLKIIGGRCAGFQYDLYFEDAVTETDEEYESNGVKLYVDPVSYQYLESTEIDYVEGAHGSGFKFNNPNVKGSCGCGSSVSF